MIASDPFSKVLGSSRGITSLTQLLDNALHDKETGILGKIRSGKYEVRLRLYKTDDSSSLYFDIHDGGERPIESIYFNFVIERMIMGMRTGTLPSTGKIPVTEWLKLVDWSEMILGINIPRYMFL